MPTEAERKSNPRKHFHVVWIDTARDSHTLCAYAKNEAHAVQIADDWAGESLSSVESATQLETDWANCPTIKD